MERLTKDKIEIQTWQMIPERMAELGLTADDGMTSAWYAHGDKLYAGAEAINHTMRSVWYIAPLTYLYYVPGIRQVQNRVYQWIADNRYKMPGATDACAVSQAGMRDEG